MMKLKHGLLTILLAQTGVTSALAQDAMTLSDAWQWRAAVYAWFPNFRSTANVPIPGGGKVSVDTDPSSYLSNLQFAYMGSLEGRKGRWSFVGDTVYADFDKANPAITSIPVNAANVDLPVPVTAHVDLKGLVATFAAGYALSPSPATRVDAVAGVRYLRLKAVLDAQFNAAVPGLPPPVHVDSTKEFWDGIVGLRGSSELGDNWFVPFHVDVGAGSSRFTWQAFGGVGYHFGWGDAMVGYRHLAYKLHDDGPVSDLAFSGPVVGVAFRF